MSVRQFYPPTILANLLGGFRKSDSKTMWIPEKVYEALPAIYFAIGALLTGGSVYVGLDHGPALGYLILGSMSIGAGVVVRNVRLRARAGRNQPWT